MTTRTSPSLPAPLEQLRRSEPGLLYYLASKPFLLAGTGRCNGSVVVRAEWEGADRSVLMLVCEDGARITFSVADRLVPHCDCPDWGRHSQCPHVVATWIQLKRLLSPSCFPQIRIDRWVLDDLADLVGLPPGIVPGKGAGGRPRPEGHPRAAKAPGGGAVRFVLEERHGVLRGAFRRGDEEIHRGMEGAPRQVLHHVQRFPFFEARIRFLASVAAPTGANCPIVFRDPAGRETPLSVRSHDPVRACLAFVLEGGRVAISRTVNGLTPLAEQVVVAAEVLLDLDGGAIYPLSNRGIWGIWDDIRQALVEREEGEGAPGLGANLVETTADRFNRLTLRLTPGQVPGFGDSLFFCHGATPVDNSLRTLPTYGLELESPEDEVSVHIWPLVSFDGRSYTFSGDLFRYFHSDFRELLPPALKAKKRVRALAEACLELAAATTPAARRNIIRSTLGGPDFLKRSVRNESRQILATFAEDLLKKPLMIQALPDGWRFAEDDRQSQARLMTLLYELFGARLLWAWQRPGRMTLSREELFPLLPQLAGRLRQEGYELTLNGSPLTAAVWDFTLDATTSALDWFELRPEIRCDGELLGEEELRQLAAGGVLARNGRLILMDDANARILAMLAGTLAPEKRRRKSGPPVARIPRLQILDWLQLRNQGVVVRLAPRDARVLESLLNFEAIPARPLPASLVATLRPYQQDGYRWLAFLYEHRFGACLADDMGLGKTVQGISLLAGLADGTIVSTAEAGCPHLIVVPPSLLFNWENELARFFPSARLLTYGGQGRSCHDFGDYQIVLTSYGIIQRDIERLVGLRFDVIIFDEAQVIKNLRAATTAAARRLAGSFKVALTGTPVENRIDEYYAIMDLCLPGLLGNPEQFRSMAASREQGGLERLLRRTRPFVLRRNKQLIAADLPEKIETDIHLELSPRQKALYQRTIEEVRGQVDEAFANRSPGQARIIALTALLRLRQICLAPSLALAGAPDSSPKLDFLLEQLAELADEGHSVLVFSQFTSYLDLVENGLRKNHLPFLRLDGSTPTARRRQLVQSFQHSHEPQVFLISLKAGGKGLNLTRATYVYHLDPWWNPAVENQASDRAHRIGQTRQVTITRLVMRHTIEEKMMRLKEQKQALYRAILEDGAGAGGAGLTREDLDFLLS